MSQVSSTQPRHGRHAKPEPPTGEPSVPLSPVAFPQLADASLGELVREAATHFSTLFRSEVVLAKAEVTVEVREGVQASGFFVIELEIVVLNLFFLFFTA